MNNNNWSWMDKLVVGGTIASVAAAVVAGVGNVAKRIDEANKASNNSNCNNDDTILIK